MTRTLRLVFALSALVLAVGAPLVGQEMTLASARQLYGSAAYDEALSVLERLRTASPAPSEAATVEQYRAFCLMALGRQADAVRAIEAVVVADPFFAPNDSDVSPRVVSAFRDARRRLVPGVAQQRYLEAKSAYDRKDYTTALAGFDIALRLAAAPDLAEAATQAPLSDVRVLAAGFRDLAKAAAVPPPPPPQPEPERPAPVATPTAAPPPPAPAPVKPFYTADDAGVAAPVVITQRVPRWPATVPIAFMPKGRQAVVEVLIDERGAVAAAVIRQSSTSVYDILLAAEAKNWRYKPATKDNVPVKFMKLVQVALQ